MLNEHYHTSIFILETMQAYNIILQIKWAIHQIHKESWANYMTASVSESETTSHTVIPGSLKKWTFYFIRVK